MQENVLIALIAFATGFGLAWLFLSRRSNAAQRQRRVESQLEQLRTEYTHYQAEVAEHFNRTAELLGELNARYHDMFNHLARGAERLCNDPDFKRVASNAPSPVDVSGISPDELEEDEDTDVAPPLDYAPKRAPDEAGMLSEKFGLAGASATPDPEPESDGTEKTAARG